MASGPTVGGDDGGREKQRYAENKVYTRKAYKGSKKDRNPVNTVAPVTATSKNDAPITTATTTTASATAANNIDSDNNSTVKCGNADEAKVNSNNISDAALPVAVPEDGNLAQPQLNSGEGGNLSQPQVYSREDGNLAQRDVCSREDEKLAQLQVNSTSEDGKLAQPLVNSTLEDGNSAQPQGVSALEDGNLAELQVDSALEDGNSAQPQVDSALEDGNSAQPQVDSALEDGNSARPLVNSTLEDGKSAQPQVNSTLEDGNSAQPVVTAQPQVDSTLEDGKSAQPLVNSTVEDGKSAQPLVDSTFEGGNSAQPLVNSTMDDGNLAQPQVGSTLEDVNLTQPLENSTLEDRNSAQPQVVLVSDDSCSRQHDEPSSLNVQRDDAPSSPDHSQDAVPRARYLSLGNGAVEPPQDDDGPSSPSRQQDMIPSTRGLPSGNGLVEPRMEERIKINLASKSKQEMQELRWKLESELDIVRSLVKRIEVKQGQVGGYSNSNVLVGDGIDNWSGARRAHSEVASAGAPRESTRPLHQLSLSMLENSQGGVSENVEKEKRMPKANQFYRNSEFLLAKDKFPPAESNKKSKLNWKKQGVGEMGHGLGMGSKFFKSCSSLLEKLMKHKHGWVFNAPVDVEGLGLHDYFTIITHPMDLGTVKSRLNKNWYKSPKEFAEDVRLTFRNAMTYNPKGQDVHIMAEQLSKIFEDRWAIIESDYNREMRYGIDYGAAPPAPSPLSRKVPAFPPPPLDMRRILNRSDSLIQTPRPMSITPSSRTPAPKKPKAKDPHKRDMTFEEKQKLSTNLQSLPSEKLDAIVQIIKKRNSALSQHDDEIEVDIDSVDAETLWELDRFVTNYKKSLSKNKRKAELAQARAQALQNALQKRQAPVMVGVPRETQADERNVPPSLPVQGGNQADNGSRSSSSSSSSSDTGSSSSDSDSDSSSASGSDAGSQGT